MSLKVVGRTPSAMRVREVSQSPAEAKEISMRCGACGKHGYVKLPYQPTPEQRQQIISAALDEHRRMCKVGAPEDGRSYEIIYPRA